MKATIQGGFFALRSKANKKAVFTLLFSNILIWNWKKNGFFVLGLQFLLTVIVELKSLFLDCALNK
jgi:hypothetical protein